MKDWEPELYNRFRLYRAEPVEAILRRLRFGLNERIVDLGCGSGENAIELARRVGSGLVHGIDSSRSMIEQARRCLASADSEVAARVSFDLGDIRDFEAFARYTLIFSNAALHWIEDQRPVFRACHRALVPGGRLVIQMPSNDGETAQQSLSRLALEEPWRQWLRDARLPSAHLASPAGYRAMLEQAGFEAVDCYYQSFAHPMNAPAEIVEWKKSTALRPFMAAMPEAAHENFLDCFRARLESAYGTAGPLIFHFRRIFLWARRPVA